MIVVKSDMYQYSTKTFCDIQVPWIYARPTISSESNSNIIIFLLFYHFNILLVRQMKTLHRQPKEKNIECTIPWSSNDERIKLLSTLFMYIHSFFHTNMTQYNNLFVIDCFFFCEFSFHPFPLFICSTLYCFHSSLKMKYWKMEFDSLIFFCYVLVPRYPE